jgi:hypothetical protein
MLYPVREDISLKTLHLPPSATIKLLLFLLVAFGTLPTLRAADKKVQTDGDPYKFKIQGDYWRDSPSITIKGDSSVGEQPIDFDKEFGFDALGTYDFIADWHITHKQHLFFGATQYTQSKSRAITEDITFRGVTYKAGAVVDSEIKNQVWAPGYQYDILRNERGHLGIPIQVNMMDISTKLNGQGIIVDPNTGNSVSGTYATKGSVFAFIPVAGPDAKYLFIRNSDKYYVEGFVKGMYFFGYGNFVSTRGDFGVNLWKGLEANVGYQMGSRLAIHGTSDRLDIRFTQRGLVAGLGYKW